MESIFLSRSYSDGCAERGFERVTQAGICSAAEYQAESSSSPPNQSREVRGHVHPAWCCPAPGGGNSSPQQRPRPAHTRHPQGALRGFRANPVYKKKKKKAGMEI